MGFAERARVTLADTQARQNIARATRTIRDRTARVAAELPDWEALRDAGRAIKAGAMACLDEHLLALESRVQAAGGTVHWAEDAAQACRITIELARRHHATRAIKVKSITTDEIRLNAALQEAGIEPVETDLADMIVQLSGDTSSHFLVPAIHRNRAEIGDLFRQTMQDTPRSNDPAALTGVARLHLRRRFLDTPFAISGANFAVAETGAVCVLESEGNGRMCLTLPKVLVAIMGIEKVLPRWDDLSVFLQLLPRASTGERMNPYTSIWTGVHDGDGPEEFHLILLDHGRSRVLADPVGREALHCIRCSRCLNVCPVYQRAGGHAYASPYQGPIGSILTPQLQGMHSAGSLPFASTLCGACAEVCPVKIDIPNLLVHLRARAVREGAGGAERATMAAAGWMFGDAARLAWAQRFARMAQRAVVREGAIPHLPGVLSGWTATRDFPAMPAETFRQWWARTRDPGRTSGRPA